MNTKKVFGYIFITLSILLALLLIGQLPAILAMPFTLFKILTGSPTGYEAGYVIGQLIFSISHLTIVVILWIFGRRWTKKVATVDRAG